MQVISSNYLNNRFLAEKLPIECYSVHPGVVRTNLFIHFQLYRILMLMLRIVGWVIHKYVKQALKFLTESLYLKILNSSRPPRGPTPSCILHFRKSWRVTGVKWCPTVPSWRQIHKLMTPWSNSDSGKCPAIWPNLKEASKQVPLSQILLFWSILSSGSAALIPFYEWRQEQEVFFEEKNVHNCIKIGSLFSNCFHEWMSTQ